MRASQEWQSHRWPPLSLTKLLNKSSWEMIRATNSVKDHSFSLRSIESNLMKYKTTRDALLSVWMWIVKIIFVSVGIWIGCEKSAMKSWYRMSAIEFCVKEVDAFNKRLHTYGLLIGFPMYVYVVHCLLFHEYAKCTTIWAKLYKDKIWKPYILVYDDV